jgi:hypothetical protein
MDRMYSIKHDIDLTNCSVYYKILHLLEGPASFVPLI